MDATRRTRYRPVAVLLLALTLVGGNLVLPTTADAVSFFAKLDDEGQFELTQPWGVATDEFGDVYVVSHGQHRVIKFDGDTFQPIWATVGGFGSDPGQLSYPQGIAIGDGTVFVADTLNHRIAMFTYEGQVAGGLTGGDVPFAYPADVDFRDGFLYVTNGGARCAVDRFQKNGSAFNRAGVVGGCGSEATQFANPAGIAVDDQYMYVTDVSAGVVKKFFTTGGYSLTIGSQGTGPGQFQNPDGIAVSTTVAGGTTVWVVDSGENSRVQRFTGQGEFVTGFGGTGNKGFTFPHGIALSPTADKLWVTDTSGEDPNVYGFVDSEPALFFEPFEGLRYLVKTEGIWFRMGYNQATKTCTVLVKATVSAPGHPSFTVEEDFKVHSANDAFKVDVSDKQAKWMKQAEGANKKVAIDTVAKGKCSENAKVTARDNYKAS